MHIKLIGSALLGISLTVFAATARPDTVVIVSAKSPIGSLSENQVAEIFLGRLTMLPDGISVIPIDQAEGSVARNEFHAKTTHKSAPLLKAYWSKLIFTGKGQPPREAADDAAVKKLVAESPNAIGYVDRSAMDNTVRAVMTAGGR